MADPANMPHGMYEESQGFTKKWFRDDPTKSQSVYALDFSKRPMNSEPFSSYKQRMEDTINGVINSIPPEAIFAKTSPEFQDAVRRFMVDGADGVNDEEKTQIQAAMRVGILPPDLENKGWEKIFRTPDEEYGFLKEVEKTVDEADRLGFKIFKAITGDPELSKLLEDVLFTDVPTFEPELDAAGKVTGVKPPKSGPSSDLESANELLDRFLGSIGFDRETGMRDPDSFINVAIPEDRQKFMDADLKQKIKYIFGTPMGIIDKNVSGIPKFLLNGLNDIVNGGKPTGKNGEPAEEPWKDKTKRIFTNSLQLLRPIENMVILLQQGAKDVTGGVLPGPPASDERVKQAYVEFYDNPLLHYWMIRGGMSKGLKMYKNAKVREYAIAQSKEAQLQQQINDAAQAAEDARVDAGIRKALADRKEAKAAEVRKEVVDETVQEFSDWSKKQAEKEARRAAPKAEVPVEEVNQAQTNEILSSKRNDLAAKIKERNPEANIDEMTRYEMEYLESGGNIKRYPRFYKSAKGPVKAGFYEGAEAEWMLTGGKSGTEPSNPIYVKPTWEYESSAKVRARLDRGEPAYTNPDYVPERLAPEDIAPKVPVKPPEKPVETKTKSEPQLPLEEQKAPETTTGTLEVAKKIEPEEWFRGEDKRNSGGGDKFYSASEDVAGNFGKVSKANASDMPKNPLIVDSKESLAERIGYDGDPLAEPLNAKVRFDDLAKSYAKKNGHDGIIYENGTLGEREMHVFVEGAKRVDSDSKLKPGKKTATGPKQEPVTVVEDRGDLVDVKGEFGEEKTVSKLDLTKEEKITPPEQTEGYKAGREVIVPMKDINVDTKRFQPRTTEFSEDSAARLEGNYDNRYLDPIVVWRDPVGKKIYVLSGHSRFEGLGRAKQTEAPVRFFEGTESEAIQYAHGLANEGATPLTIQAKIKSYQTLKSTGMDNAGLKNVFGPNLLPRLEAYQNLSPLGKFIEYMDNKNTDLATPGINHFARWIGELREKYGDKLTNYHENQLFEYLYQSGKNHYTMPKDKFVALIDKNMGDALRTPEMPLDLGQEMNVGLHARADTGPIVAEIRRQRKIFDEAKEMRNNAQTVQEIKAQSDIMDEAQREISRLQGGIDELVEKQGDMFAEPAKPSGKTPPADIPGAEFDKLSPVEKFSVIRKRVKMAEEAGEKSMVDDLKEIVRSEPDGIKYFEKYDALETEAKARLRELGEEAMNNLSSGVDPVLAAKTIKELATIGYAKMAKGLLRLDDWSREMIAEHGDNIRSIIPEIYAKARRIFRGHSMTFRMIRNQKEADYIKITRQVRDEIYKVNDQTRKWDKEYTEAERNDVGAMIEGIDNIAENRPPIVNDRTRALRDAYRPFIEQQRQNVNAYLAGFTEGEYIDFTENYLMHLYEGRPDHIKNVVNTKLIHSPSAKARKMITLKEAMGAGLKPVTQDVSYLTRVWADMNWRIAGNRKIANMLKNSFDEFGNRALSLKPPENSTGWERFDSPALKRSFAMQGPPRFEVRKKGAARATRIFDTHEEAASFVATKRNQYFDVNQIKGDMIVHQASVWVAPEYRRIAHMAFDNPYAKREWLGYHYDVLNGLTKSTALLASFFHNINQSESGVAMLGVKEIYNISTGRASWKIGKKLISENPEFVSDAIMHGLQPASNMQADMGFGHVDRFFRSTENYLNRKSIPYAGDVVGIFRKAHDKMNRHLWSDIHEGYKFYTYYKLTSDILQKFPDATPEMIKQIKESIAASINNGFGGQEWESHLWLRPRNLMYARRALLAPDYTWSNLRIAGVQTKTFTDPIARRVMAKYWVNMALGIGAATVALNYAITGHGPWDNEYDHKYDIEVTPIIKAGKMVWSKMPLTEDYDWDADKTHYYARLGKQAREIFGWFTEPWKTVGNKMGMLSRQVINQATGTEIGSGWEMPWRKEDLDLWENLEERAKHAASMFRPFSFSESQFAFTVPMYKGMSPYKGIKAYQEALDAKSWTVFGEPTIKENAIREISDALILNGQDGPGLFKIALGGVKSKYYKLFYDQYEKGDFDGMEETAVKLLQLQATWSNLEQSLSARGATREDLIEARRVWRSKMGLPPMGDLYENIIGPDKIMQQRIEELKNKFNQDIAPGGE